MAEPLWHLFHVRTDHLEYPTSKVVWIPFPIQQRVPRREELHPNETKRPQVDFVGITSRLLEQFGSHVDTSNGSGVGRKRPASALGDDSSEADERHASTADDSLSTDDPGRYARSANPAVSTARAQAASPGLGS